MGETTGLNRRRIHFLKVRAVSLQSPSATQTPERLLARPGSVLQTANGGQQWSSQPSVTFNYLHGVSFTDANTGSRSIWRDSQDSGSGSYAPANADTQARSHTCASTIMSAARKKISH